ncbi:MAG: ABC transporter permease subunit [Campylobacteraceae bacterium]|jgi:sulfate transport system permease protein|nr:ABC transporter permease subunit [Campylobacteraceae bacterium]
MKIQSKPFLLSLSALSVITAVIGAFSDIRIFITLILISGVFALTALNADFKSRSVKTTLFAASIFIAGLSLLFAFIDIRISITLFVVSGFLSLAALNINDFALSQIIINIIFFAILIFILSILYYNPNSTLTWILLIVFALIATFVNKINIILFAIFIFILSALYYNPNHALAWVSLIVFTLITALANKISYKKSNPKLPGFGISLGLSLTYMSFLILIPLSALVLYSTQTTWEIFWATLTDQRITTALKISFGASFTAALINCFFGLVIAWILTRYNFLGKRIVDSVIDLPFAVPTAVAGISLAYIFSPNGVLGDFLQLLSDKVRSFAPYFEKCADGEECFSKFLENIDFGISYSTTGIVIALVFIGLPFVVRTLQPVIEELEQELEEAASSLGANFYQIFRKVIFPSIYPALLTGFALAFARGLGEYGSVIFISSNMPYESEIVPLLIVKKLTQFDYVGASVIGVIMLAAAFVLLLLINFLQSFARRRKRGV